MLLFQKLLKQSVEEFCDLCWQYRQSLFRNDRVLQTLGLKEKMEMEKRNPSVYSDKRINEKLTNFKQRKIIVRDLSNLPDDYKEQIEKLKQQFPRQIIVNFMYSKIQNQLENQSTKSEKRGFIKTSA